MGMPGSYLTAGQSEQLHGYSGSVRDNSHRLQLNRFELDVEKNLLQQKGGAALEQTTGVVGDLCLGKFPRP